MMENQADPSLGEGQTGEKVATISGVMHRIEPPPSPREARAAAWRNQVKPTLSFALRASQAAAILGGVVLAAIATSLWIWNYLLSLLGSDAIKASGYLLSVSFLLGAFEKAVRPIYLWWTYVRTGSQRPAGIDWIPIGVAVLGVSLAVQTWRSEPPTAEAQPISDDRVLYLAPRAAEPPLQIAKIRLLHFPEAEAAGDSLIHGTSLSAAQKTAVELMLGVLQHCSQADSSTPMRVKVWGFASDAKIRDAQTGREHVRSDEMNLRASRQRRDAVLDVLRNLAKDAKRPTNIEFASAGDEWTTLAEMRKVRDDLLQLPEGLAAKEKGWRHRVVLVELDSPGQRCVVLDSQADV